MRDGTGYTPVTAIGTTSPVTNTVTINNVHNDVEAKNSVVINEDNKYIDPGEQLKQAYVNTSSVYTYDTKALAVQRSGLLINDQDINVNENGDGCYLYNNLTAIGRGRDITAETPKEVEKMITARTTFDEQQTMKAELQEKYPDYLFLVSPLGLMITAPNGITTLASDFLKSA